MLLKIISKQQSFGLRRRRRVYAASPLAISLLICSRLFPDGQLGIWIAASGRRDRHDRRCQDTLGRTSPSVLIAKAVSILWNIH